MQRPSLNSPESYPYDLFEVERGRERGGAKLGARIISYIKRLKYAET